MVEVLVALALFAAVTIPLGNYFFRLMSNDKTALKITALALAQQEMERTIGLQNYEDGERTIRQNNHDWIVKKTVAKEQQLAKIVVQVFKKDGKEPLLELKTLRLQ